MTMDTVNPTPRLTSNGVLKNGAHMGPSAHAEPWGPARPITLTDFLDLRKIWSTLVRERWLLVGPVLAALAVAISYLLLVTPRYAATSMIVIDAQQPKILTGDNPIPGLDISRFMIGPVIDSQVAIVQSTPIVADVVRQLRLWEPQRDDINAALADQSGPGISNANHRPGVDQDIPDNVIQGVLANLDVRRYQQTLILQIQYSDPNPKLAAAVANAFAEAYINDQLEQKRAVANTTTGRLSERVAALRQDSAAVERKIQTYRVAHNLVQVAGQTMYEREIAETLAQLTAARADAANKYSEISQIELLSKQPDGMTSLSRALSSATIGQLRQQEAEIMRKLSTLANQYGKQDPLVIRTQDELKDLRAEIDKEIARVVQNTRNDYEVASGKVKLMDDRLTQLLQSLAKSNESSIEVAELERRSRATSDLYNALLARLMETQAQESFVSADARLVAKATVPANPSSPKKTMTLALALLGGIGLGLTAALLKAHVTRALVDPEQLKEIAAYELVATVPTVQADGNLLRLCSDRPDPHAAQAMFLTKRWLMPRTTADRGTVVAVLSSSSGDGKTTIAAWLASYAAVSGTNTLLMDLDLRDAELSRTIAAEARPTITDAASGHSSWRDALVKLDTCNLDMMPAPQHPGVVHPMEQLASPRMAQLLEEVRKAYQLVVIDTTSLVPFVDAQALLDHLDSVLIVVKAGHTTFEQHGTVERLLSGRHKLRTGIIWNLATTAGWLAGGQERIVGPLRSLIRRFGNGQAEQNA